MGVFCNRIMGMNNRDHKEFAPGEFYHVYNRGNGKMNIFRDEEDFNLFLFRLEENLFPIQNTGSAEERLLQRKKMQQKYPNRYIRKELPANAFGVVSYCLMPNHFHMLIKQNSDVPVSKLLSKVCTSFSKYFNKKYNGVGSVFQDRFKAIHVDNDDYLLWLSAYIHQNPAVAGLVRNINDYKHSSYLDYISDRNHRVCDTSLILGMFGDKKGDYVKFVKDSFELIKEKKELSDLFLD
jgi:putative transposase